jgi:hypothetical protein
LTASDFSALSEYKSFLARLPYFGPRMAKTTIYLACLNAANFDLTGHGEGAG